MLDAAEAMKVEELVFITQDINKGDWVYKPKRIRDENGHLQENVGTLTLAHPLLVQEALQHCPTLRHVHIISVATFALVLRNYLSQPVPKLVAALQTSEEAVARYGRAKRRAEAPASEGQAPAAVSLETEITFRSTDLSYEPGRDNAVDRVIQQLGVEDWTVQNKAVQELQPILGEANRDQLVQIGRAVANAVNESAVEPLEFLKRVLSDMGRAQQIRSNILVGVLANIYLNEAGDPRKPAATSELAEVVFAFQDEPQLASAYEAVLDRLQPQRRAYLGFPRDVAQRLTVAVGLDRGGTTPVLRSATVGETELLEEAAPESRRLPRAGLDETLTIDQLLYRLSGEFVVPARIFEPDQPRHQQVVLPANTGFVRWGPGTGVTLR